MKQEERENLWGYAKRLRFVRQTITEAFPRRESGSLKVLDVGCGNGSQLALPLAQDGFQVTGVDTHAPSIEHAGQNAGDLKNARFVCGRVEDLKLEPFDIVILSEVLEHVTEPRELLTTSMRYLASDGIMIVTVPNGFGEFEIDSWLYRKLRGQRIVNALYKKEQEIISATDNHADGHVQFFTRRRLLRLFEECSLSVFRQGAGSFLAGPMVGHTLARAERFIKWNSRVADRLPLALASGWYFALRRRENRMLMEPDA
jgi:2-polyprenyl-3-methyl-5-hydroxy-6-metoxy-1,4-benzoquinol methylase